MNNLAEQLFQVIIKTIPSFEKIKTYDRNHIFFDIIKFSTKESTENDTFSMYFIFNKYQKILQLLRKNNFSLAEHHLKYLNNNPVVFSNKLSKIGMESLYFPVIAYYYYKKGEYNLALKNLYNAYPIIDDLYAQGFIDAPFCIVEQKTNECKILLEKKEIDKALDLALSLLKNILDKHSFLHYKQPFSILCQSSGELTSFINYIIEKIILKSILFEAQSLISKENILNFFISIKSFISENKLEPNYNQLYHSLIAIIHLLNNEEKKCFELLTNNSELILNNETSSTTAYLLYKAILDYLKKDNINKFDDAIELLRKNKHLDGYSFFIKKLLHDAKHNTVIDKSLVA